MKLSVSLSEDDLRELDRYVHERALPSRSAGVQHAIQLLRAPQLSIQYADAFAEWETSVDAARWNDVTSDGLVDETW